MPEGVFARGGDTKLQEQLGFSPKTPFDGSQCSEFLLEKGPGMRLQNVVVFHNTATVASAWCCAEGIVSVLREMGYNVETAEIRASPKFRSCSFAMPTLSLSEHRNGLPEKSASTTARYGIRFEQKSGLVCRVVHQTSRFQFQFGSRLAVSLDAHFCMLSRGTTPITHRPHSVMFRSNGVACTLATLREDLAALDCCQENHLMALHPSPPSSRYPTAIVK